MDLGSYGNLKHEGLKKKKTINALAKLHKKIHCSRASELHKKICYRMEFSLKKKSSDLHFLQSYLVSEITKGLCHYVRLKP